MIVRIRFGRGPRVERRKGKNSRVAWLAAGLLTLGSVNCLILGIWRLGIDLGWTTNFVFADGLLSHWQVWFAAALILQASAWKLNRYGKPAEELPEEMPAARAPEKKRMAAGL
jgi:hypothetical protein